MHRVLEYQTRHVPSHMPKSGIAGPRATNFVVRARRYHQLVKQADAHRVRSAEASKAAQVAAGEHASLMKEVHLHNSRHAELWAAAERYAWTTDSADGEEVSKHRLQLQC